jgi:hypothetical protein
MADRTPGQAAYEAYCTALWGGGARNFPWRQLSSHEDAAWEAAVAAAVDGERKRLYAELGNDHYVIFTEDRFTVEHSVECKLSGHMHECAYHAAVVLITDEYDPDRLGRWRITGISDGLPDLERAEREADSG